MGSQSSKVIRALSSFWFVSTLSILVALFFAIYLYRLEFSGGFSTSSSDWSNFGSYIGGVFGPFISFVTLLAVLKTVYLQRELMRDQRRQFEVMNDLQEKTFESQSEQLRASAADSARARVSALQVALHSFLELKVASATDNLTTLKGIVESITSESQEVRAAQADSLLRTAQNCDLLGLKIDALLHLAGQIVLNDYESEAMLREEFRRQYEKILAEYRLVAM